MALTTHAKDDPAVFAAASLRDLLEDAAADFAHAGGGRVRLVFAASSVLARQIDAGAPASLFLSADEEWMDWLAERGAIDPAAVRIIAANSLVVARGDGSQPAQTLAEMLTSGRFAMGDPNHVPAGRYAAAALERMGIWDMVRPHAVFSENVRVALEFLRRGEVDAAIVYSSDMTVAPELVKAYEFPDGSHAPIRYAAVLVPGGDGRVAGFLEYLTGEQGQELFAKYGFLPVR